jgi:hypothetical protein
MKISKYQRENEMKERNIVASSKMKAIIMKSAAWRMKKQ